MKINIEDIAKDIADDLKQNEEISIDDIAWESLYAVDEIKCAIFDKVYDILEAENVTIHD